MANEFKAKNGVITPVVQVSTAGSADAPAITKSDDLNTGIFFPSADTIAFAEGGLEAVRINSNGNFGINTISPEEKLHVIGAITAGGQAAANKTSAGTFDFYSTDNATRILSWGSSGVGGAVSFWTGNGGSGTTEKMRLDASGNLAIGITSAASKLHVYGGASGVDTRATIGNAATALQLGVDTSNNAFIATNTANVIQFYVNSSEKMRIDASGAIGLSGANYGTSGQVLTSNGSGSAPTWTTTGDVTLTGTQTLTNKRINPRVVTGGTSGTLTIAGDTTDTYNAFGLTGAITFAQPSGTPVDGQRLTIRVEDNGVARGITWTTSSGAFRAVGVTLPTTTVASKVTYIGCVYNSTDVFWDVIAVATQA